MDTRYVCLLFIRIPIVNLQKFYVLLKSFLELIGIGSEKNRFFFCGDFVLHRFHRPGGLNCPTLHLFII